MVRTRDEEPYNPGPLARLHDWLDGALMLTGAWLCMVVLGPLLLRGELIGPAGHVHWRQILTGIVGTGLWASLVALYLL